jgi:uncharacterized membrane protein YcaP (DUF421 family)
MNTLTQFFGEGPDLNALQMGMRAIAIFIISLVLIRMSGRRAFGIRMPFDNVVTILLGAILSRALTGASPFLPTVLAATTIVLLHRLCGYISLHNKKFGYLIKGEVKVLYKDGKIEKDNMHYGLISEKDLIEGLRIAGHVENLEEVNSVYLERNGQISVIKKKD